MSLQVLSPFLTFIKFHKIPAKILMTEIYPLDLVPNKYVNSIISIKNNKQGQNVLKLQKIGISRF